MRTTASIASIVFAFALLMQVLVANGKVPDVEETSITVFIRDVGSREVTSLLSPQNDLYLSVEELFAFMQIRVDASGNSKLSGFYISEDRPYEVDMVRKEIIYRGIAYSLNDTDIIGHREGIFLTLRKLRDIFEIECVFDFRSLSVQLQPNQELPVVRAKRLEKIRANLTRLNRQSFADTVIKKNKRLFQAGVAEWSLYAAQYSDQPDYHRATLGLGASILGGEAGIRLAYSNNVPFADRQQHYFWRHVNNENRIVRQVILGKINPQPISTILSPVLGATVTNERTYQDYIYGSYQYSNYTKPDWHVELYVNNILVNYTQADASGFYTFPIPLTYGNTEAELRCYGPYGEEETKMIFFNIPFQFLRPGTLSYRVSSGVIQDGRQSRYGHARVLYGITRQVTMGAGIEYLSSASQGKPMPYLTGSLNLVSRVVLNWEYSPLVRTNGKLNYTTRSGIQFDLHHSEYVAGQDAVKYVYTREHGAAMSGTVRVMKRPLYTRLNISRNYFGTRSFISSNLLLSASVQGVSMNVSTFAVTSAEDQPFIYSNFSASTLIRGKVTLNAMMRYIYADGTLPFAQVTLRKKISEALMVYGIAERAFDLNASTFQAGVLYNLPFVRADMSALASRDRQAAFQQLSGSVVKAEGRRRPYLVRQNHFGRGGVRLTPFVDLDGDGERDEDEPIARGLAIKGNMPLVCNDEDDGSIAILALEPYNYFNIQLHGNNFENIYWVLGKDAYRVYIEPNVVKNINIPVEVHSDRAGQFYHSNGSETEALAGVPFTVYRDGQYYAASVTDGAGYFQLDNLKTGRYTVKVDTSYLARKKLTDAAKQNSFVVEPGPDGTSVYDLKFELTSDHRRKDDLRPAENNASKLNPDESDSIRSTLSAPAPSFASSENMPTQETYGHGKERPRVNGATSETRADPMPTAAAGESTIFTENTIYRVVAITSARQLDKNNKLFEILPDVRLSRSVGKYHYVWADCRSEESARILKNELNERGFAEAKIIVVHREHKPNPEAPLVFEDPDDASDINYRVQVIATREKINIRHSVFRGLKNVQVYRHQGMYKYTWGRAKSLSESRKLRDLLVEKGFEDCFIVPFIKNRRLTD